MSANLVHDLEAVNRESLVARAKVEQAKAVTAAARESEFAAESALSRIALRQRDLIEQLTQHDALGVPEAWRMLYDFNASNLGPYINRRIAGSLLKGFSFTTAYDREGLGIAVRDVPTDERGIWTPGTTEMLTAAALNDIMRVGVRPDEDGRYYFEITDIVMTNETVAVLWDRHEDNASLVVIDRTNGRRRSIANTTFGGAVAYAYEQQIRPTTTGAIR